MAPKSIATYAVVRSKSTQFSRSLPSPRLQFDPEITKSRMIKSNVTIVVQDHEGDEPMSNQHILEAANDMVRRAAWPWVRKAALPWERESNQNDDTDMAPRMAARMAAFRFCLTGIISFNDKVSAEDVLEDVLEVHKAGDPVLVKICEKHLIKTIDKTNLARLLEFATKMGLEELRAEGCKFLYDHYDELAPTIIHEMLKRRYYV